MLSTVLDWLKAQKQTNLKALLAEHTSSEVGKLILQNQQNFAIHQGTLYLCSTPKGETGALLLFMVPKAHHVATLNVCLVCQDHFTKHIMAYVTPNQTAKNIACHIGAQISSILAVFSSFKTILRTVQYYIYYYYSSSQGFYIWKY